MIIPTNDLINYEGENWQEYLDKMCLYEIFKDLVEEYGSDKDILTGIIRYIVWCYSIDSNKIVIRQEWLSNKKRIFKAASLPAVMEQDVIYLKNPVILYCVKKWLTGQNEENFAVWSMLNDLIVEMRIAANMPIKKATSEIDYKTKMDCAGYVIELQVKKAEVEQKFIQNNEKLKEAYKEVSHLNGKQTGTSFGLESMLKEEKI